MIPDMKTLSQILAIERGVKARSTRDLTDAHREIQKTQLLSGLSRTYRPLDDEGDQLPPEGGGVQIKAEDILQDVSVIMTRLFDVIVTKDTANMEASAPVKVDSRIILDSVPAVSLLFLDKQLVDLRTFVEKIPTLDPAEHWERDTTGVWAATPIETTKLKKIPHNHVKAAATDKHPAQVEMFFEDNVVGYWTTTKFSGALPAERVHALLGRIDALLEAVKFAREEANSIEIMDVHVGKKVFDYLFA